MNPHFTRSLKVTGIVIAAALVTGLAVATCIYSSDGSARKKRVRAEMLGEGLAMMSLLVIFPFWVTAAARVRREKDERTAMEQEER